MRLSPAAQGKMLKWILPLVIAIFLLGMVTPHLARFIRFGKRGRYDFRLRGQFYTFPFATTIIFSLLLWLVSRII